MTELMLIVDMIKNGTEQDNEGREMKIELEAYDRTCADGCCTTYGYDVFVDGEKIGFTTGEDAFELAELLNEHFKD